MLQPFPLLRRVSACPVTSHFCSPSILPPFPPWQFWIPGSVSLFLVLQQNFKLFSVVLGKMMFVKLIHTNLLLRNKKKITVFPTPNFSLLYHSLRDGLSSSAHMISKALNVSPQPVMIKIILQTGNVNDPVSEWTRLWWNFSPAENWVWLHSENLAQSQQKLRKLKERAKIK